MNIVFTNEWVMSAGAMREVGGRGKWIEKEVGDGCKEREEENGSNYI